MKVNAKQIQQYQNMQVIRKKLNKKALVVIIGVLITISLLAFATVKAMTPNSNDNLLGEFDTIDSLNAAYPNGTNADGYCKVGSVKYFWSDSNGSWLNSNEISEMSIAKNGENGKNGQDGKSAYDLAVDNGYSGTLEEWLNDIEGKDAFDLDVQNGFTGSYDDWKNSLQGADGINGKDGTNGINGKDGIDGKDGSNGQNGDNGKDGQDGINGQDGKDGDDGRDGQDGINGQDGTPGKNGQDGENGQNGKSAYQVAIDNGFSGTEEEWLESLKGGDGVTAYQSYVTECNENGDTPLSRENWLLTLSPFEYSKATNPNIKTIEDYYESLTAYGVYKFGLSDPSAAMSKEDWLASLKGEQGEKGEDGTNGRDG